MKLKSVTVAKIERDIYQLIESGEKKLEIRDEEIKTGIVCFVDSKTGKYLGSYRIGPHVEIYTGPEYSRRDMWYEVLSKVASIPESKAEDLFSEAFEYSRTLYIYELGEKVDIMGELFPKIEEEDDEE